MSVFSRTLLRLAVGHLRATLQQGQKVIFVSDRDCPKPSMSVGIDSHLGRCYCRKAGRECKMLQMVLPQGDAIVCKGIESQERTDK